MPRGQHNGHKRGADHYRYNPGVLTDDQGYVLLRVPEHPHADCNGYVREHIVVMERKLGRALLPGELVHHEDENKRNNDPANLTIKTRATHNQLHNARRGRDQRGRFLPGGLTPKSGGKVLDGREWCQFPEVAA